MSFAPYIYSRQKVLTKMWSSAIRENRLGHAYLLVGEEGAPLKETAVFLAKSILCDSPSPLSDESCHICTRIDSGSYPDFILLDGADETVKKEQVEGLESLFSQTALEKKGIMVYVINLVENMTEKAANAILKFLEEPSSDTYAILTTQNQTKVLPTIASRCQIYHLRLAPRDEVIAEAIKLGVSQEDAELLSPFCNEPKLILDTASSPRYPKAKEASLNLMAGLLKGKGATRFAAETASLTIKDKPALRLYFDLVCLFLLDVNAHSGGRSLPSYGKIVDELAKKIKNPQEKLLQAMTMRQEIETNVNAGLLLTHLASELCKE